MWKIREWRGGGSGEKEGDPERRESVEKKSTCKQQFTRKEKGALSQTLKFNMIYIVDIPLHIFIIQSICIFTYNSTFLFPVNAISHDIVWHECYCMCVIPQVLGLKQYAIS